MATDAFTILRAADDGLLASRLRAVRELSTGDFAWRARARVRVLRNFTVEPLGAEIALAGYRRGVAIDVAFAPFDTYAQEILDPASPLARTPLDFVILALWLEDLPLAFARSGEIDAAAIVDHVDGLVEQLLARHTGRVVLTTFVPPQRRITSARNDAAIARANLALLELAERHARVSVIDLRRMIERLGEAKALDARGALLHRAPLKPDLCALWAGALADTIAAACGLQRKVLALDCDGCLWGGVIGEDGLDGIRLGPDSYPGNAYLAFQEQVLALQRAGVLVVLCSKNEEADVLRVLTSHPHCRIRPEYVAAHRINWASKADNLQSLADELHVGLDSFVFVDDSPFECALVREALPMVDVRRAPEHAADLPSLLRDAAALFGAGPITDEDRARTRSIHAEQERAAAARAAGDLDSFLASLALVAEIDAPEDDAAIARVAQLTQRTNQFNATTRRYDAGAIAAFAAADDTLVLAMRAADRFGDYGLVGVAIAIREDEAARIDTLLLSCRALGRRLEDALVGELVRDAARRWGAITLRAEYLATAKNGQMAGFFDARGFACVEATESRRAYVATDEAAQRPAPPFIAVRRRERR